MDEIHRVCTKNNIKYYLIGGTLLGAVRHKGFIPWDDDLDIVMPREDLNRFLELAPKELGDKYELEWHTTRPYYQYFPKVSLKRTLFFQSNIKEQYQSGIFVDVFPIDLSPEYDMSFISRKKKIRRISRLRTDNKLQKKKFSEWAIALVGSFIPEKFIDKWIESVLRNLRKKGETHYANFGSGYSIKRQTMPIEWFGDGIKLQFEDRVYKAPILFDKVLKSIFGANYMELPPVEKRFTHYPLKVIFSDGSKMEFSDNRRNAVLDVNLLKCDTII